MNNPPVRTPKCGHRYCAPEQCRFENTEPAMPAHECPEWDFMLIKPGDPEMDACLCKDDGECFSCIGGKCTAGPHCVATSNPLPK